MSRLAAHSLFGRSRVCDRAKGWHVRKCKRWLLLTVGSIALVSPCYGEQTFWTGHVPPPHAVRVAQAREWLAAFEKLDRQVPRLSPSESAWLKREIASGSGTLTPRVLKAMDSTEYHKRVAGERVDNVLADLRKLSTSEKLTPPQETTAWITLVADMIDPELWQSIQILVERKLISADINGVKHSYLENHVMWAREVLNRVVLPMSVEGAR